MAAQSKKIIDPKKLDIIGSTEYISVDDYDNIPAKVDTGADSSSIWVSDVAVREDGTLTFKLFSSKCSYYDGKILERKKYTVSIIKSSNGNEQIRYRTKFKLRIKEQTLDVNMTLADRSRNAYPILVGRKTISGKFLVDVSQNNAAYNTNKGKRAEALNQKLSEDPYKFHQKYIERKQEN